MAEVASTENDSIMTAFPSSHDRPMIADSASRRQDGPKPVVEGPKHPKVLVTRKELQIALGMREPDALKEGEVAKASPVLDFLKAGKGIVAKEYVDGEHNGKTRTAKAALKYAEKGFGENSLYRGVFIDEKKADPALAKGAIEATAKREGAMQGRQRAAKAPAKNAGREM